MNPWVIGGLLATFVLIKSIKTKASYQPIPPITTVAVVEGGRVSSPYLQMRGHRDDGSEIIHNGIDIKAPTGTPIRAVADGFINKIWLDGEVYGYGNLLLLYHDDGLASLYAHLDSFGDIYEGMPINKGEIIGFVGQTQKPRPEMKTAPHLHLEILDTQTRRINPDNPEISNSNWVSATTFSVPPTCDSVLTL
jgi:murein DD-endopeptidase MepM/ murein hydrolase activator NlpD